MTICEDFENKIAKQRRGCPKAIAWLIVVGLWVGAMGPSLGKEVNDKAKAVLLNQYAYFQKLNSLDYKAVFKYEQASSENDIATISLQFQLSGDKYHRSVVERGAKGEAKVVMIYSFDGKLHQFLSQTDPEQPGILVLSSKPLSRDDTARFDPILELFSFAFTPDELAFSATDFKKLKDKERWEKLADAITNCEEKEMMGHKGIELTIVRQKTRVGEGESTFYWEESFDVFFASDLAYFPLYVLRKTQVSFSKEGKEVQSEMRKEIRATEVKSIAKSIGDVFFPIKEEIITKDKDGKVIGESTVEMDSQSLKINEPIEDDIFTIPRSRAGRIINEDTKEVIYR